MAHITAEPFELIALSGFGGHTRVQGKARVVGHSTAGVCLTFLFWQGSQGEDLATLLRAAGDYTVGDGVPVQLRQHVIFALFQCQPGILRIAFE